MSDHDGSTRERGRDVENFVASMLQRRGVEVLERNFEEAGAEVDLIGRLHDGDEPVVVFVEIRSRSWSERGSPLETVDAQKQRRVIRGATAWLVKEGLWEKVAVRFDVVGVIAPEHGDPEIEWIENAFETT